MTSKWDFETKTHEVNCDAKDCAAVVKGQPEQRLGELLNAMRNDKWVIKAQQTGKVVHYCPDHVQEI